MKVLILGAGGQLGWELSRNLPKGVDIYTCDYPEVDFGSEQSIRKCVATDDFDWIINAAAYTAVDNAEQESGLAWQINCQAVEVLAGLCREKGIRLVHISTDFVFSGERFTPYLPDDTPDPVSVYGQSKLAGEQAVLKVLGDEALIIRTAWLYSSHGANFVKTMLRLMKEKEKLGVVHDQIGTPTWAKGLAQVVWAAVENGVSGIHHWTDAGVASWYDFALAIQEEALALGLLEKQIPVMPIGTKAYPTPARRPHYSVLDSGSLVQNTGTRPLHWRWQLRQMLMEIVT